MWLISRRSTADDFAWSIDTVLVDWVVMLYRYLSKRTLKHLAIVTTWWLSACGDRADAQPDPSIRPPLAPIVTTDTTIRAATLALTQGRPWEATRLLAPLMRVPARRSPAAVLRAAEAASAWEGWTDVIDLLANEPWLRTDFGGHGYVLLSRAALSVSPRRPRTDSIALRNAQFAMPLAATRAERGERATLLARAYERVHALDSARVYYLQAAQQLPVASDWLRLRAANVTADERIRQHDYQSIRGALAREQVGATEAAARENIGDRSGAASMFEKVGKYAEAFRVRMRQATDNTARDRVQRDIVAYLARAPLPADARDAIAVLDVVDRGTVARNAGDELTVARAAATVGLLSRAVAGYASAAKAGIGTDRDFYSHGDMLVRLGRHRDAAAQFARVAPPSPLAGSASYQRARALLRAGDVAAAHKTLTATHDRYRSDTAAAAAALYLLADLASDASRDGEARHLFLELVREYPTSPFAPQALLRAALIAFLDRQFQQAARELDTFNTANPSHSEILAAQYWSGRAWKRAGNDTAATTRWHSVLARNGASYYAMLAARALGEPVWAPGNDSTSSPVRRFADIDSAHARARILQHLGLLDEMRSEDDRLARDALVHPDRAMAAARGFAERGNASRSIALARRALDLGAPSTAAVYRLLYPVTQEGVLLAESARSGLDPALVAALIRQESSFTAHATSPAGARGLMQLMPTVGGSIARRLGFAPWDAVLLYQADVNVQLGTRHLAAALAKYAQIGQALAAYNAGDSRVARWSDNAGGYDAELFVERIPFIETRDYVRIILRNRELYRALYGWPPN